MAKDFSASFTVKQSPQEVFDAVTNVRGWWSEEIDGGTAKLYDEFYYHYRDVHECWIKLIEVVPNSRIVWLVKDNHFNFTKDEQEWKGTKVVFDITPQNSNTTLQFTHVGLVPEYECYEICHEAWSNYIKHSLRNLIERGKGEPNPREGGFNGRIVEKWNLDKAKSA